MDEARERFVYIVKSKTNFSGFGHSSSVSAYYSNAGAFDLVRSIIEDSDSEVEWEFDWGSRPFDSIAIVGVGPFRDGKNKTRSGVCTITIEKFYVSDKRGRRKEKTSC